jgi:hypothetical protein
MVIGVNDRLTPSEAGSYCVHQLKNYTAGLAHRELTSISRAGLEFSCRHARHANGDVRLPKLFEPVVDNSRRTSPHRF